jgi:hypothetical protein
MFKMVVEKKKEMRGLQQFLATAQTLAPTCTFARIFPKATTHFVCWVRLDRLLQGDYVGPHI